MTGFVERCFVARRIALSVVFAGVAGVVASAASRDASAKDAEKSFSKPTPAKTTVTGPILVGEIEPLLKRVEPMVRGVCTMQSRNMPGWVAVQMVIGTDGTITESTVADSYMPSKDVPACIARTLAGHLKRNRLPKKDKPSTIVHPVVLRPAYGPHALEEDEE